MCVLLHHGRAARFGTNSSIGHPGLAKAVSGGEGEPAHTYSGDASYVCSILRGIACHFVAMVFSGVAGYKMC